MQAQHVAVCVCVLSPLGRAWVGESFAKASRSGIIADPDPDDVLLTEDLLSTVLLGSNVEEELPALHGNEKNFFPRRTTASCYAFYGPWKPRAVYRGGAR